MIPALPFGRTGHVALRIAPVPERVARIFALIVLVGLVGACALIREGDELADSVAEYRWLMRRSRYAKAVAPATRVLELTEAAYGPDDPRVSTALDYLADAYLGSAEYDRAAPLYERSLSILEGVHGPEHQDVLPALDDLALLYRLKGDYPRARRLLERSLTLHEKLFVPDSVGVAKAMRNLARLYFEIGDYARAEALLERSLAIVQNIRGPDHPDLALVLFELANFYLRSGDSERAERMLKRCLEIWKAAPRAGDVTGSDRVWPEWTVAAALNDLANVYLQLEDYQQAEALYTQSLAICERTTGPEHPEVAVILSNLGLVYVEMADYQQAEPLLKRSLEIQEKLLGSDHPKIAHVLNILGILYRNKGDYRRSELPLKRSIDITERALGPTHPKLAWYLSNLARTKWASGEFRTAQRLLERAAEIEERQISLFFPIGSDSQARAYMETVSWTTNLVLSLQRANPLDAPTTRLALTTVLRRKGRILDVVMGSMEALRHQTEHEDRATLDRLLSQRSRLARIAMRGPGPEGIDNYRKVLSTLAGELEELERTAYRRGRGLRVALATVRLDEVQARIPPDSALIEAVTYNAFDPKPAPGDSVWGPKHFGVFVVHREGDPRWVDLGEAGSVVERTRELRELLSSPTPAAASVKLLARELHELIMAPIEPSLGEVSTLLIAPDGALNLVPFGALVNRNERYLVERYTIAHLTSGRDLLRLEDARRSRSDALVMGAPEYGARLDAAPAGGEEATGRRSRDFRRIRFEPLPGTLEEVEAVGNVLAVEAKTGAKASEEMVKRVRGPRIVHLATHAFFLGDQEEHPQDLRLLGPVRAIGESDRFFDLPPSAGENALLRSGLALAGANRLQDGDDDGILTALELAGLDLWGTKLVVLSACDTALGKLEVGEGVYGLRRAVVIAGAESQLVSLWKVNDEATRRLMIGYYKGLAAGRGRAEALRRIQLEMLEKPVLRDPYYWASFISIGAAGPIEFGGHDSATPQ